MNKYARKPSSDPAQEQLRQNKQEWNKEVSELIHDVINFKKLINGSPSVFFQEKSKIIEPIPGNPVDIISNLTNKYNSIAQKAEKITQEQDSYSKNRKKKKTAAIENYEGVLTVEASNIFSRFFTKLLTPTFGPFGWGQGGKQRIYRMSLLDSLLQLYRDIRKFERKLGKGYLYRFTPSTEDVKNAKSIFLNIESNWNSIINLIAAASGVSLETIKESLQSEPAKPKSDQDKKKEKEKPPPTTEPAATPAATPVATPAPAPSSKDSSTPIDQPTPDEVKELVINRNKKTVHDIDDLARALSPSLSNLELRKLYNRLLKSINIFSEADDKSDKVLVQNVVNAFERLKRNVEESKAKEEEQQDEEDLSNNPDENNVFDDQNKVNNLLSVATFTTEDSSEALRVAVSVELIQLSDEANSLIDESMDALEKEFNSDLLIRNFALIDDKIKQMKSKYYEILYPGASPDERRRILERETRDKVTHITRQYRPKD
jgi:hypothetical protein